MRQQERLALILDRLATTGSVAVVDLVAELDTSPASIRRDLQALEEQQLLKRTHGGAVAAEVIYELPMRYRAGRHQQEKRRIAEAAALLVDDSVHSVGLSGGTTTSFAGVQTQTLNSGMQSANQAATSVAAASSTVF